ncbi:ankyrin repeat-containing protein NPR4 [Gossypium raimondii]|uniref:ankyrin repeat-containing protein NPR4 n=1 Tax=Gossypium raimondii TaxID=29730 RepID=UPI00227B7A45|nr:ankyrin repeat-containing protein NPR4 [Gossypium raimondii]
MVSFLAKHQVRWQTRVRWPPLVRWLRRVRKLRRVRWQPRPIIAPKPEEREQNITYMDASLYKAAAEGKIEVFNNYQELDLESQKTPNHDNVLHVNLATHELAAWFSNGILSRTRSFPKLYFFILLFLWFFIIKKKSEKRSDFIRQILTKCPSLLLQTNAKGQTPLHVAAMNGHSAIVKLLIKSCAKARDGDLEKLEMGQVNAVREMLRITDQESNTALHLAVKYGDVEMVKELLEHEDPDFQYSANKNQETPLYLAAKRGDTGMLSILLEISNSTGHGCPHSRTALHAAAMAGDIAEATTIILKKNANLIKERDEDGHTPLHYAAHLGCISVVEELLKTDVSAAYIGDRKLGMTPLLMAARQGYLGTVRKILFYCPDCCDKVDKRGLSLLHYLAFRDSPHFLFIPGGTKPEYGSLRNLRNLEGDIGFTPDKVSDFIRHEQPFTADLREKKPIEDMLKDIAREKVAEFPVLPFHLRTVSAESLEKSRDTNLVVAALIATVAFAAAITVPGGFKGEKGLEQGTPVLIHEIAFKAFVVTNALAFIFSICALAIHFGVNDFLLSRIPFWITDITLYQTRSASNLLSHATTATAIAFSTGSYVVLKPSHGLAIASCFICPALYFCYYIEVLLAWVEMIL